MINAAKRDRRVTFQTATKARGALGVIEESAWTARGTRWAAVRFGSSAERRAAAQETVAQAATFRCLADTVTRAVLVSDRILFDGVTWDITGIATIGLRPDEIEFTAVANRG